MPVIFAGLTGALVAGVMDWNTSIHYFNEMMVFDNFAVAFSTVMVAVTLIWFVIAPGFFKEESSRSDHASLIIFTLIGGVIMVSFSNLLMLFLGIEILS